MELVLGKKFKFEVWETVVQMMALNEVASFTVDKSVSIWGVFGLLWTLKYYDMIALSSV